MSNDPQTAEQHSETETDSFRAVKSASSTTSALNALEGLIKVIAEGRAIVYLGAGVSQSAGLPSWNDLLKKLQDAASGRLKNQGSIAMAYFDKHLKAKSRSLEVGDWLLTLLGPEFQQVISNLLSEGADLCQMEPSELHWNLVRLPFSMALTTNYDLLLEMAYERAYRVCRQKLPYLTWKHTVEIIRASNQKHFRIVHAHGTVGDSDSIVLSGTQYTTLYNAHPRFGEVLKMLLKTKTFVFVGAGLEDPDLVFQLQEAIAEHGGAVGPHYALLPYSEAPQIRRDILRSSLHIEVIQVGSVEEEEELRKEYGDGWLTILTGRILRDLSGEVALKRFDLALPGFPTSDEPTFCLKISLRKLLQYAIEFTGSYRGDFCLSPDGVGSHLSGELLYSISEDTTGGALIAERVRADSICGIAYYQATTEHGVRVGNVRAKDLAGEISKSSKLGHYGQIVYVRADNQVNSEMAIPIEANGVRIGVLNLESNLIDAYSDEHLKVARRFAEKAGRLYAAAHERRDRGKRLDAEAMSTAYKQMRDICSQLWCIARNRRDLRSAQNLALLIYRADFVEGKLVSQNPMGTILTRTSQDEVEPQRFDFHNANSSYLATRVFLDGRPYFYPDVWTAVFDGRITNQSIGPLGLSRIGDRTVAQKQMDREEEPVIGFPVLIHGHIAGVVVAWIYHEDNPELDGRDIELFRRASHLMANNFEWTRKLDQTMRVGDTPEPGLHDGSAGRLTEDRVADSSLETGPEYPSIEKVNNILSYISQSDDLALMGTAADLNNLGEAFRNWIGSPLLAFLRSLCEQERKFFKVMCGRSQPTYWVSPRRCRCWIRGKPSPQGKPRFVLALQVDISKDADQPVWKNLYCKDSQSEPLGIAMQPFRRPQSGYSPDGKRYNRGPIEMLSTQESIETIEVENFGKFRSLVFDDNPHLSFLLSRISAYPFAFPQRPGVLGHDIMHKVLDKDPLLPWFVGPLIVVNKNQWRERTKHADDTALQNANFDAGEYLAGYLTFDNGPAEKSVSRPDVKLPVEIAGEWAKFQNDLLHQIALFGACLAQRQCFQDLVK